MDPENKMHEKYIAMQPNYSRLLSPSIISSVSIDSLTTKDSQVKPQKKPKKTWLLQSDPESMIFFRTQSHLFPYVQVTSVQNIKGSNNTKSPKPI